MAAFKASLYFQLRSLFQYNDNIYKLKSCQTRNSSKDQQCCTGMERLNRTAKSSAT